MRDMIDDGQNPFTVVVRSDSQSSKRFRWEVYGDRQREFSLASFASQEAAKAAGRAKMEELISVWRLRRAVENTEGPSADGPTASLKLRRGQR